MERWNRRKGSKVKGLGSERERYSGRGHPTARRTQNQQGAKCNIAPSADRDHNKFENKWICEQWNTPASLLSQQANHILDESSFVQTQNSEKIPASVANSKNEGFPGIAAPLPGVGGTPTPA